mmetsp:Transcript_92756/g.300078  ORF Transcript_92756/g.300078 Transcript_92756/m.300078 type:complete len:219 (+) Transcript_92756:757-1413(+)
MFARVAVPRARRAIPHVRQREERGHPGELHVPAGGAAAPGHDDATRAVVQHVPVHRDVARLADVQSPLAPRQSRVRKRQWKAGHDESALGTRCLRRLHAAQRRQPKIGSGDGLPMPADAPADEARAARPNPTAAMLVPSPGSRRGLAKSPQQRQAAAHAKARRSPAASRAAHKHENRDQTSSNRRAAPHRRNARRWWHGLQVGCGRQVGANASLANAS